MMQHLSSMLESIDCKLPSDQYLYYRDLPTSVNDALTTSTASVAKTRLMARDNTLTSSSLAAAAMSIDGTSTNHSDHHSSSSSSTLDNGVLLYFVTEIAFATSQNKRPYQEDRVAILPRCRQRLATTTMADVANLLTKVSLYGVFDGHGGQHASEYVL